MAAATVALTGAGFAALLAIWLGGGGSVDVPWAPTLDLRLHLAVDGLGALYGLLAAGIGCAVALFTNAYLPRHLAHQDRPQRDARRFWAGLALFAVAMVGLVCAQDLVLLFVCWDVTAIASWALIGFDRGEREARTAALTALLLTGVSALLLLVALLLLQREYGTLQLPELLEAVTAGTPTTVAGFLIAVAALAKSAQVPLHFWLPRAMTAPTPVSAYLHSAAMVAAGVFLLTRMHGVLAAGDGVLELLTVVGLASIAVGGVLALTRDTLKQVLAYSTISQYGYVTFLLGLGTPRALTAASFYVLVHAPAKCALFMTAGAVTEATGGRTKLSELGGLLRETPVAAATAAVAAATLAAFPLTGGFFKDELLFGAAAEAGSWQAACALVAAMLTFAYLGRFWARLFLGRRRASAGAVPVLLLAPGALLAALLLVAGVVPGPAHELADAAAAAAAGHPVSTKPPAYHLDLRLENVLALSAYAGGALLLASHRAWIPALAPVVRASERFGPDRLYVAAVRGANRCSRALHDFELRDLRGRLRPVIVPAALLVGAAVVATAGTGTYAVGGLELRELPLLLAVLGAVLGGVAAALRRDQLSLVVGVSACGFALAVTFGLLGGPDVALVAVVIGGVQSMLLVGVAALVPLRHRDTGSGPSQGRRIGDGAIASAAGALVFLVVWGGLSRPPAEDPVAARILDMADEAHAKDAVAAILTDFRGLDTLVEITVVLAAVAAFRSLLGRRDA